MSHLLEPELQNEESPLNTNSEASKAWRNVLFFNHHVFSRRLNQVIRIVSGQWQQPKHAKNVCLRLCVCVCVLWPATFQFFHRGPACSGW